MAYTISYYHGNMLDRNSCWVLDRTGLPCGQPIIIDVVAPTCEAHARYLHNVLTSALLDAAP